MGGPVELFIAFIAIGLFLIAVEVFVPGGVLGVLGGISLLAAAVAGFFAFGPQGGMLAALAIVLLGGAFLAVWIKIFPRTGVGRVLTLTTDEKAFKSSDDAGSALLHKEGVALTNLHPAGKALIDGHRTDVVSESAYIDAGQPVRVIAVEGIRVIVRAIKTPAANS